MDGANIACGFLFLTGLATLAQPPVFRPGPDVQAPFVVAKAKPDFTEEARLAKLEGSVLLSLVVGADGHPRDIQVARTLGLGLDESAVENVGAWQFQPGTKNGTPVDVLVNEEVFFRPQRTLWDWHLARAVFRTLPRATRPVLTKAKFPATVDLEQNAFVIIGFDVGPNGVPVQLRVVKSSNTRWEMELLAALRQGWRFRPGTLDGKPAATPAWFEFVRGSHSPLPTAVIPAP